MLTSIVIHQFRSCRGTTVKPNPRVTALIGKNGAGKTSILRAVAWAAGIGTSNTIEPFVQGDTGDVELRFKLNGVEYVYRVRLVVESPGRTKLVEALHRVEPVGDPHQLISRDGPDLFFTGLTDAVRLSGTVPAMSGLASLLPEETTVQSHIKPVLRYLEKVRYLDLPFTSGMGSEIVTDVQYATWLESDAKTKSAAPALLPNIIHLWLTDRPAFERLVQLVGGGGIGLFQNIHVHSHEFAGADQKKSRFYYVVFQPSTAMGGSDRSLFFSSLSEGSKRLLHLILSSLFVDYSVLLVEQPEDSLHSGILRKLIDLVRGNSRDRQILFSTHSAAPLDMLRPEELVFVTAVGGITKARGLNDSELQAAGAFLDSEGSLGEFAETMQSSDE